ncbi:UNVERIFIED_CONTAM: hypothetical protein H355_014885 [Colinus virginianus]|nr:hypothetical protein H355_014885 [Colinus virginianus]
MEQTATDEAVPRASQGGEYQESGDAVREEGSRSFLREPLVWVDCEMTGLDVEKDQIIEIAVILTDGTCDTVIEGPTYIIHADDSVLDSMSEWCRETHGRSGLTEASRSSTISLQKAEEEILAFVKKHVSDLKVTPLAGNSVHVDRRFLLKQMPKLATNLSYRIVDVSSIKELWHRWRPNSPAFQRVSYEHRALGDIRQSINELRYYKKHFFVLPEPAAE